MPLSYSVVSDKKKTSSHIRFIHCSDLHLESVMNTRLSLYDAQQRRQELMKNIKRLSTYALEHSVRGIFICGDIFDTPCIAPAALQSFLHCIEEHPTIDYIILPGNHDAELIQLITSMDHLPSNLKLVHPFMNQSSVNSPIIRYRNISVYALPDHEESSCDIPKGAATDFNIYLYHGQIMDTAISEKKPYMLSLNALRQKNIDYLAAGHIHSYKYDRIDHRGIYCYSGCLEGRGFDECGSKGFVLIDIVPERHTFVHTFVPFASRTLYDLTYDISDYSSYQEIESAISHFLSDKPANSYIRLTLTGELSADINLHLDWLTEKLSPSFYYIEFHDATNLKADWNAYAADISFKGEFIRLVLKDTSLSEKEREQIIKEGLKALSGEEIPLLL